MCDVICIHVSMSAMACLWGDHKTNFQKLVLAFHLAEARSLVSALLRPPGSQACKHPGDSSVSASHSPVSMLVYRCWPSGDWTQAFVSSTFTYRPILKAKDFTGILSRREGSLQTSLCLLPLFNSSAFSDLQIVWHLRAVHSWFLSKVWCQLVALG